MKKKLNLFDLTPIGVGIVIGAGIFSMMGWYCLYGQGYRYRAVPRYVSSRYAVHPSSYSCQRF